MSQTRLYPRRREKIRLWLPSHIPLIEQMEEGDEGDEDEEASDGEDDASRVRNQAKRPIVLSRLYAHSIVFR